MEIDVEAVYDRTATESLKWTRHGGPADTVPLWVADMDLPVPTAVQDALAARLRQPIFGYDVPPKRAREAVVDWCAARYDWAIEPSWIVWLPGVMPGVMAAASLLEPQAGVVLTPPIYPVFRAVPADASRPCVECPLVRAGDAWTLDASRLAAAEGAGMLLFCSPHNPTGRVWTRPELEAVAAVCCRRDLLVCSDEIWADLVLDEGCRHLPLAAVDTAVAARTITLMAGSKTFNLAGLFCAFAIVPERDLRRRFRAAAGRTHAHPNGLGWVALEAALRHGEPWRQEVLAFLRQNREAVFQVLDSLPGLRATRGEATFLAWIDATDLGVADLHARLRAGGVVLSDGAAFGAPGWLRLNFACPRSTLAAGLERFAVVLRPLCGG